MYSSYLALFGIFSFFIGYRFYSKYISDKIFQLNDNELTPSHQKNDGIDFVPTNKHILFGHHFTSIAGAAPIIGPCIAAYWGWLPALLWVVLGTIFIGAVHDFGALVMSAKENGNTVPAISSKVINNRIKVIFLIFVMFLTWLVIAVFTLAIAGLFIHSPYSVLPVNIEIIIAIIMGYLIYKKNYNFIWPSIIALFLLYLFIWIGTLYPISLPDSDLISVKETWVLLLLIYSGCASLMPVWLLLQPRDYINSHQLIVGLLLIYIAIFYANPLVSSDIIRMSSEISAPPIFPFLFVTIACGAISGFHGLVSSGTTSKQLNKMSDARMIGYGGMIGEGFLALATTISAVAGIALVTQCSVNGIQYDTLSWSDYYGSWNHAVNNKALAFVLGGSALLEQLGFSSIISKTLISVLIISFAATTLDTASRIQRFVITELGNTLNIKLLKNKYFATICGLIPAYFLTINESAWQLWPIFGASNQMLAALTLMVLSIYFINKKNKFSFNLIIPMIIIVCITMTALIYKLNDFIIQGNSLLIIISFILIFLIIWMLLEGIIFIKNKTTIF